jgi:lauroyl/myristoyl acyltransferase
MIVRRMARNPDSEMMQAIRSNQSVVRNLAPDDPALDQAVLEVMESTSRSFVDSFKAIAKGNAAIEAACYLEDETRESLLGILDHSGMVLISPHVSGMDMFIFYLGVMGYPILGLSYPDPTGSYVGQNKIRRKFGFNIIPISLRSLKEAVRHLKNHGLVMTAVDRPELGGEPMRFFGREVVLPIGHARLALKTNSPLVVTIPYRDEDGIYQVEIASIIQPNRIGNEHESAHAMAQEALHAMEPHIRRWADRWMMFYPLWPETIPSNQA